MKRLVFSLSVLLVGSSVAAPMGRLFFTPEERARIDLGQGSAAPTAKVTTKPTINGFVRRGNGTATVWIDGKARQESAQQLEGIAPRVAAPAGEQEPRIEIRIHRR
ncbi:hypothetical protein [Nitrogeniibacter aestuarii]|uniref:hypothetical protein n=1 Tax=Nitrogeniibacter aestuarii TaxID=2815343 RepID=UPI001D0F4A6F|nr:hypothetical protein [Nitrogeniibacter aestuarii]